MRELRFYFTIPYITWIFDFIPLPKLSMKVGIIYYKRNDRDVSKLSIFLIADWYNFSLD